MKMESTLYLISVVFVSVVATWKFVSSSILLICFAKRRRRRWPTFATNILCITLNCLLQGIIGGYVAGVTIAGLVHGVPRLACLIALSGFQLILVHRAWQTLFTCIQRCLAFRYLPTKLSRRTVVFVHAFSFVLVTVFESVHMHVHAKDVYDMVYKCTTDQANDAQYVAGVFGLNIGLPYVLTVLSYICMKININRKLTRYEQQQSVKFDRSTCGSSKPPTIVISLTRTVAISRQQSQKRTDHLPTRVIHLFSFSQFLRIHQRAGAIYTDTTFHSHEHDNRETQPNHNEEQNASQGKAMHDDSNTVFKAVATTDQTTQTIYPCFQHKHTMRCCSTDSSDPGHLTLSRQTSETAEHESHIKPTTEINRHDSLSRRASVTIGPSGPIGHKSTCRRNTDPSEHEHEPSSRRNTETSEQSGPKRSSRRNTGTGGHLHAQQNGINTMGRYMLAESTVPMLFSITSVTFWAGAQIPGLRQIYGILVLLLYLNSSMNLYIIVSRYKIIKEHILKMIHRR